VQDPREKGVEQVDKEEAEEDDAITEVNRAVEE
jgi:hypothetical protein